MADLFQSEYEVGSLRRGVQDGETLWALLAEDGTVTIVPDPTEEEVLGAGEELSALNAKKAEREREGKSLDPEKEKEEQDKIAALSRKSSFQPPVSAQLPAEEEEDEGNGRKRQSQEREKAETRS